MEQANPTCLNENGNKLEVGRFVDMRPGHILESTEIGSTC